MTKGLFLTILEIVNESFHRKTSICFLAFSNQINQDFMENKNTIEKSIIVLDIVEPKSFSHPFQLVLNY